MYNAPIRAKYSTRQPVPQQSNFGFGMGELSLLLIQLTQLKQELIQTANAKLAEIDKKIQEHLDITTQATKDNVKATRILEETKQIIASHIETVKQGLPGKDADEEAVVQKVKDKFPTKDSIVQEVLSQIPKAEKVDEESLTKRILKALPENKASLKIIQEQFEVDPMSVIEKIMALPPEKLKKLKLKKENIDGLEQTMSAFNNQLGRGYLHGGGDTVQAGTNITIVKNSAGKSVISSTGGAGFTILTTLSTVDGSNQSFVFSAATAQPSLVVVDGIQLTVLDNNGATQWSWNSGTKTVTLSTPPPINSIFAYQ